MRDCYAGECAVKDGGQDYLPATAGQILDWEAVGRIGYHSYCAYKNRAVFPEFTSEAVFAMVGAMHSLEPVIELPAVMEPLRERATLNGESLTLLLRRINEAQLITGRIGLMLDLPSTPIQGQAIPYIATYDTERILNWDDGKRETPTLQKLNLVVLDESEMERQTDFQWEMVEKYRVLVLGDTLLDESVGIYRQQLYYTTAFVSDDLMEPSVRGQVLDEIPFVFINSRDLLPEPDLPPLAKIARLCLTIYRGEADYRQNLHMQAQDTLVVKGGNDKSDYRIGAGAVLNVPTDGDAAFIGVSPDGLGEQRSSLENDYKRAESLSGTLLDQTSRAKESGEALKVRVAAQTATLTEIALTGAEGLQAILRIAAKWIGADPNQVIVTPNTEFADSGMTMAELRDLMDAKVKGLPVSDESLHALAVENELTDKKFEDEKALLAAEREASQSVDQTVLNNFLAGKR